MMNLETYNNYKRAVTVLPVRPTFAATLSTLAGANSQFLGGLKKCLFLQFSAPRISSINVSN